MGSCPVASPYPGPRPMNWEGAAILLLIAFLPIVIYLMTNKEWW